MVGLFTDEFRIEAEVWTRGKVRATGRQLLWLVVLTLGARALTVAATRRVIVQGG